MVPNFENKNQGLKGPRQDQDQNFVSQDQDQDQDITNQITNLTQTGPSKNTKTHIKT